MKSAPAKTLWPYIVIGLILVFLGLTFWSVRQATQGVSGVTNDKYYSHGLRYNETQLEQEAAAAMGWSMETELVARRLDIRILDSSGGDVDNITCSLELFPGKGAPIRQALPRQPGGRFTFDIPAQLQGQITIRLQANREGASLSRTLLVNL